MANPLEEVKKLTIGQLAALVHAIGGPKAAEMVLKDFGLASEIKDLTTSALAVAGIAKKEVANTFVAMVDYAIPSYRKLQAAFAWVANWYKQTDFKASDICRPVSREPRELEFVYVHMGRVASTGEVLAAMERRNLRPALYEEGLGFAKAYPDAQKTFPIVMLGSVGVCSNGGNVVASLGEDSVGRYLDLEKAGNGARWADYFRFLAVSK